MVKNPKLSACLAGVGDPFSPRTRTAIANAIPIRSAGLARAREVDQVVAEWVITEALDEAMAVFDAAEVAAAPVYDITDLVADEQLAHREVFIKVDDDELGAMTVQAPVPRFSGAIGRVGHLGPRVGAHNAEVYGELLGLAGNDLDDLHARGVL